MFKLSPANRFVARLLAGVAITAAVVLLALGNALSHAQAFN